MRDRNDSAESALFLMPLKEKVIPRKMDNYKTFIGNVSKITHNDKFLLVAFRLDGGGSGRTYAVPGYMNYPRWAHLKVGDIVSGLKWHPKKRGLIDADSSVKVLAHSSALNEEMRITA